MWHPVLITFDCFLDEFKDTQEGEGIEGDNEGGWDVDDEDLDLPDLVSNAIGGRGGDPSTW